MPQLDIYAFFSTTTALILIFLILLFCLHTYILPKLAQCLKFLKEYILSAKDNLEQQFAAPKSKINGIGNAETASIQNSVKTNFWNLQSRMHLKFTLASIFFVPLLSFTYFVKIYSIISLTCSSVYLILSLLIILPTELVFIQKVKKNQIIAKIFFSMLMVARWYCHLSKQEYYFVGIISSIVLAGFTYVRICISSGAVQPNSNIYCIFVISLYLLGMINTFFRISVSVGSRIDQRGSAIDFIGPETWDKIIKGTFKFGKTYLNKPIPPGASQPDFLKKTGLVIGGCTLFVVGLTGHEVYKTRIASEKAAIASERAAIASERAAIATERAADVSEVASGLMTPDQFNKRWSKKQK